MCERTAAARGSAAALLLPTRSGALRSCLSPDTTRKDTNKHGAHTAARTCAAGADCAARAARAWDAARPRRIRETARRVSRARPAYRAAHRRQRRTRTCTLPFACHTCCRPVRIPLLIFTMACSMFAQTTRVQGRRVARPARAARPAKHSLASFQKASIAGVRPSVQGVRLVDCMAKKSVGDLGKAELEVRRDRAISARSSPLRCWRSRCAGCTAAWPRAARAHVTFPTLWPQGISESGPVRAWCRAPAAAARAGTHLYACADRGARVVGQARAGARGPERAHGRRRHRRRHAHPRGRAHA